MCCNVMEKLEKVSNVNESEKLELLKTKEEYLNRKFMKYFDIHT